jgi:aminoacylase
LFIDEEQGGKKGMVPFLKTEEFKNLKVGLALDEGAGSTDSKLYLYWTERVPWGTLIFCHAFN